MKIVLAIDSFKGSLTSLEAEQAVEQGIHRVMPNAEVVCVPIADGGEGTAEALASALGGEMRMVNVHDPLMREIHASYARVISSKKETPLAILEMASAAGIALLDRSELSPMQATTYGVGELIDAAFADGCHDFIIGIGGSATNDAGMGMLQAMGCRFLNSSGTLITDHGAAALASVCAIDPQAMWDKYAECRFRIVCDVKNPLCGESGCSYVFAPQKGALAEEIPMLDNMMHTYAGVVKKSIGKEVSGYPGAGAAGGMGFAFLSLLNSGGIESSLVSGIEFVCETVGLEEKIAVADLVVTGEGRLDRQTCMGKAPGGVAAIAKKYKKPVIAFCGAAADSADACNDLGIDAFFPALRSVCTLEEAMDREQASRNLTLTAEQVFRLILTAKIIG